jgi:hypothetical protein
MVLSSSLPLAFAMIYFNIWASSARRLGYPRDVESTGFLKANLAHWKGHHLVLRYYEKWTHTIGS